MSIKDLYNFRESRFTSFSHGIRIYIYGADVTAWIKGDVSVTYGNRDSFNTATFDLSNPRKVWQITRANYLDQWRDGFHEYSESKKMGVFQLKNHPNINPYFNLDTTTQVLGESEKSTTSLASIQAGSSQGTATPNDKERRWRLAINDCIFSKNDPVRIFMKNPLSDSMDEWVEIFCGFVQDHPITTNYATGESSVRISCTCIRQQLLKMRVQMNALQHAADQQPLFDSEFYADFREPGIGTHPFASTSLENTIKELILGTQTPNVGQSAQRSGGGGRGGGIGDFKMGNTICFDPKSPGNLLERWHLMTLFGVNKVPFPNGQGDDLWLKISEMEKIGKDTIYWPDTYAQGPQGRYLHMLLPSSGTGAGTLVQATFDGQQKEIEWTTRWDIIRDFAKNLDFQVLTSPSGDILVEFPMYGLTPHIFAVNASDFVNAAGFTATDKLKDMISSGTPASGVGRLLTFELHQMEDTLNDEAEDFPTIIQVDGGIANNQQPKGGDEQNNALRAYVFSPTLVGRFGVITEQMQIPFAGQKQEDLDGVMHERLPKLAMIEFLKRMSDSSTWEGTVAFRPFLFPNRPCYLMKSHRIGNLTSVTNRWTVGKSAGTSFSMNMLLSERFNPNTQKAEFRLPTGAINTPISYSAVWNSTEPSAPLSGVGAKVSTADKPTSQTPTSGSQGSVGSGKPPPKGKKVSLKDKDFMFQPFSDMMQAALDKAAEAGMDITVSSTYRSPEYQTYLKKTVTKFTVGEAWKSLHQYGLACDINIAGNKHEDYKRFAKIAEDVSGGKIAWGDAYKRDGVGDYVHFEYRDASKMGSSGFGAKANELRKLAGVKDSEGGGTAHLQVVWEYLRGNNPTVIYKPPYAKPVPLTPSQQQAIKDTTSSSPQRQSAPEEGANPAPDCKDIYLPTAGSKGGDIPV